MKQCPQCKTTYTDSTLSYCLADGATLADLGGEQQTVVRRSGEPMRVEIPQDTLAANIATQGFAPAAATTTTGGGLKIIIGVLAAILLIGAIVIAGGLAFYFSGDRRDIASVSNANRTTSPTPSGSATPTPSASPAANEQDKLRNQLANLTKQINEQKNANKAANTTVPPATNQPTRGTVARVNSPGDGFLALRTQPSSSAGTRIVAIPHGAVISVGGCQGGSRGGRWCRASYNGYSGWVFDAYLVF